ncbi:MAG: hypothetical protein E2O29_02195 [Deltaproteobacteria bacterium]|nr:MAG: hypothetical protein E2O29_02195 [Deltaproteobacteria bacterium]
MGKLKRLIKVDFQELERRPYKTLNKTGKSIIDKMIEISLNKNKVLKPDNAQQARIDLLLEAIKELTLRQQKVLTLYFGLDGGFKHTEGEIGEKLGIARTTVLTLRKRAIRSLYKRISLNESVIKKIKKK